MKTTAASSSSVSSLSAASLPPPPSLAFPRFNRRPKPPQPAGLPGLKHISSLSPPSKSRPGLLLAPTPEITKHRSSSKTSIKSSSDGNTAANSGKLLHLLIPPTNVLQLLHKRPSAAPPSDISNKHPSAAPPSDISNKHPSAAPPSDTSNKDTSSSSIRRVAFESKPKKPRSAIRDVDVEQMARSNQLSKVNSATLLSWLKGRGVLVSAKHRKEELMLKVMGCLAEA
ncbi:uncharacterized protein si:ch211-152c8.2 [Anoplopoma fimbria]|uniref:uncharacterized protein si:ch211-152c8.2 n=1 Tax=Anoplopoma fimbria TaxID=229290 RepID=UPI0023EC3A3B|nr:uncharacterized protein si:ch211-152c8.2 [Anoplopoma fimbria]